MDTVWLGVKFGVGLALGLGLVVFAFRRIRAYHWLWRFMRSGCTYQDGESNPGAPKGWCTRDVRNDDWILWDESGGVVLRCGDDDPPGASWRVSNETLGEFLDLAHRYKEFLNAR